MPDVDPESFVSHGPEETQAFAGRVAARLAPGAVVALYGELGAGKTCFVQGLAVTCGVSCPVSSPTYTLINEYPGERHLVHMDLYRVRDPEEILQLGWEEFLEDDQTLIVIEWAERAGDLIPPHAWRIRFEPGEAEACRRLTLSPGGPR